MARREAPVLRNLDDPLRVLGLLSLRSCGLVFLGYGTAAGLELVFGVFSAVFGSLAFLGELALAGLLGLFLGLAERGDDEHLVPSAIQYHLERPEGAVWGGWGGGSRTGGAS
jgi:hypothetical protein